MLEWNVFVDDFNSRTIKIHNVFDHGGFMKDLIEIKKKYKDNFSQFENEVRHSLMYYYWSKCEWEIVITSFPPYIDDKELMRINTEKEERIEKYGRFIRESVNLENGEKVDVCSQVMMNWEHFIKYVWDNRNLIKRKEQKC